jgi:hypothetical protein
MDKKNTVVTDAYIYELDIDRIGTLEDIKKILKTLDITMSKHKYDNSLNIQRFFKLKK